MNRERRNLLRAAAGAAALGVASGGAGSESSAGPAIRPEQFGAKGDGVTNDTRAFAAMAQFVSRQGGGEVVLRQTTYLVGSQRRTLPSEDYAFDPEPVMEFFGCSAPLVIRGNGAVLRCASGLRFGAFDRESGRPVRRAMPNYKKGELSSPYKWMIKAERCSGRIEISDLELDGNLPRLQVGGPWGDADYQLPGCGIGLYENSGPEIIRRVYAHHHPLDGITIDGADRDRSAPSVIEDVRCEYNGRQGCSIVGGRNYAFTNCKFRHTGKAGIASAPGAGVDIEAEAGKKIRALRFDGCEFSDNLGPGVIAGLGDSEAIAFTGCTFIGTTSWSAWPAAPSMRFSRCRFVGPIVSAYGDRAHPERAAQFLDCTFLDDPALAPGGKVFIGQNTDGPIADLPNSPNARFSRCTFRLTARAVLPWTTNVVTFADCTMAQASVKVSYPRGHFVGRNTISGKADLYSAIIDGVVILNGQTLPRGPYV